MDFYRIEYQFKVPGTFLRAYVEKTVSVAAGNAFAQWLANPSGSTRGFQFDGFLGLPASVEVQRFVVDHDAVLHFVASYSREANVESKAPSKKVATKAQSSKSAA